MKSMYLSSCMLLMLLVVDQLTAVQLDPNQVRGLLRQTFLENDVQELLTVRRFSVDDAAEKDVKNLKSCSCSSKTSCGCCLHMELKEIGLNDIVCLNASYLPQEIGVEVALLLDGRVLFEEKVSARNPPPICADVPYLKKMASLCLRLYNLDFASDHFSGCAEVEAKLIMVVVEKVDLGCFNLPIASGTAVDGDASRKEIYIN